MKRETVLVLDFGGQYNQLIARRVRACGVYSEVIPYTTPLAKIREMAPKGIIFTGGPNSVYGENSPQCSMEIFDLGVPVLGICYGAQLIAHLFGGKVETAQVGEYGRTEIVLDDRSPLFTGVKRESVSWMSHKDRITALPAGFVCRGETQDCPIAAMENPEKSIYAVQFHPEVLHTEEGNKILYNFVMQICGCAGDWKMDSFVRTTVVAPTGKSSVMGTEAGSP